MPRQGQTDPYHLARLYVALVPEDVAKAIGSTELNDRVIEAARLGAQAADPALSPELRTAAQRRARAVMRAQPRAATEQQHREMIAKAAAAPNRFAADTIRRHADRLIEEEHPVAPRRSAAVRKAKAAEKEPPVPVFDENGNLIGICDADKITPVGGKKADAAPSPAPTQDPAQAQDPAAAGQSAAPVAKAVVWDQHGRPLLVDRRNIRGLVAKAADDGFTTVYDSAGRAYRVSRDVLRSPEAQARDTGPITGGTTGLGLPRSTGPAAALPADGPQRALPGDVPGRQVVKASSLTGKPFRTVGEAARDRRLAKIAKATGLDLSGRHTYARNPYAAEGNCVCEAPAGHAVHTEMAPGVPVSAGHRRVAKAAAWSPGLSNRATAQWLAAQGRR